MASRCLREDACEYSRSIPPGVARSHRKCLHSARRFVKVKVGLERAELLFFHPDHEAKQR
jgi:hypothetical protein